uniref:fascin domain-containing protein n=1 Tax=Saccharothrix mutabilis TaxID=33921 RepID=UPI0031E20609
MKRPMALFAASAAVLGLFVMPTASAEPSATHAVGSETISSSEPMPTVAADVVCRSGVTIRSEGNNLHVATEEDSSFPDWGLLRARTPGNAIGNWEKFQVCRNPTNWRTAIRSNDGCPVVVDTTASGTGRGLLRRLPRSQCDTRVWIFNFSTYNPPGSGHSTWIYSLEVGLYVSAQLDYTGTYHASLRARLTEVGPWEWFTW